MVLIVVNGLNMKVKCSCYDKLYDVVLKSDADKMVKYTYLIGLGTGASIAYIVCNVIIW